jgi:hypothetical protein
MENSFNILSMNTQSNLFKILRSKIKMNILNLLKN